MFVRLKNTKLSEKTAVQLVESVRQGSKVVQKVIRHFGYAINQEEIQALKSIALKYKYDLEKENQPSIFDDSSLIDIINKSVQNENADKELNVNLNNIIEEKRIKVGPHQVYGTIYDEIGLYKSIKDTKRRRSSIQLLRNLVVSRIESPSSKLSQVKHLEDSYSIKTHVNSIYRLMDMIDEAAIEEMQQISYEHTLGLLGGPLDVIFFDCTTLYFESFQDEGLRKIGCNKDGKFQQDQIVLALMVSKHGLPVGYEVFPGNKFEGATLENALSKLKSKYNIDKVIFVADAAMLSKENIALMQSQERSFIVGGRIKNQNKSITKQILDKSRYKPLDTNNTNDEEISCNEIDMGNNLRLIVTYSSKRALKDKYDREKAIEKAKKKLSNSQSTKSHISNSGYKRFLDIKGDSNIELNEEKIKEAECWDGLHGIVSNIKDATAKELLSHYKGLWQVEETFRISKHDMKMRPIFHWTERRIKAHIAICFMSLVTIRTLEYKVNLQYKKLSPERIRYTLSRIEASVLKDTKTGNRYVLPSQISQDAKKIYQIIGYKWRETPYQIK